MELPIIKRVAQYVTQKKLDTQRGKEPTQTTALKPDMVNISSKASDIQRITDHIASVPEDKEREERIAELKKKIEQNEYKLDAQTVDSIAEKIANTLI